MNFRIAQGSRVEWLDTRIEAGFSNFLFIDGRYRSHPVLRRIFSLARKLGYQSLLIEEIGEANCQLLTEENAAIRLRSPDFQVSTVHRLSFWRCPPDQMTDPQDFIGYAIFKSDRFCREQSSKRPRLRIGPSAVSAGIAQQLHPLPPKLHCPNVGRRR